VNMTQGHIQSVSELGIEQVHVQQLQSNQEASVCNKLETD